MQIHRNSARDDSQCGLHSIGLRQEKRGQPAFPGCDRSFQ